MYCHNDVIERQLHISISLRSLSCFSAKVFTDHHNFSNTLVLPVLIPQILTLCHAPWCLLQTQKVAFIIYKRGTEVWCKPIHVIIRSSKQLLYPTQYRDEKVSLGVIFRVKWRVWDTQVNKTDNQQSFPKLNQPGIAFFLSLTKNFCCLNLTKLWPFHNINHIERHCGR